MLPLTAEEDQVFTDRLGRYVQDALLTPDFPRAAQLLAARWTQDTGQQIDGVIATDVVAAADVGKIGAVAHPFVGRRPDNPVRQPHAGQRRRLENRHHHSPSRLSSVTTPS